jgi:hypothetical protein
MSRCSTPSSVEEVETVSPDAVLRRNFALAERSGKVIDLTEGPNREKTRILYLDPASVANKSGVIVDLTRSPDQCTRSKALSLRIEASALLATPASPSLASQIAPDSSQESSSDGVATLTQSGTNAHAKSTASSTSTAAAGEHDDLFILSQPSTQWKCQDRPSRVRDERMKLCQDHRKRARQHDTSSGSPTLLPTILPLGIAISSLARDEGLDVVVPTKQPGTDVDPITTPESPAPSNSPAQVSQPSPSRTPMFLDDSDPFVPPPTYDTRSTCRTCSTRLRDSWMTLCRKCHEESSIATSGEADSDIHDTLCLACHAKVRHVWMTWCCDCYELGLNDAQGYQHSIQNG